MDDKEIHRHIDALVAEEHRLERSHTGRRLSESEQERLRSQRDARRRAGVDPDTAQERPGSVVEGYVQ